MPWVRLDDGYPEHPKVDRVGPLAAWLNVCAWAYCARNLTDGFVPEERVARLAAVPKPQQLADRLVEAKLWERADGGFLVHDYLTYNPSRDQVLKEKADSAQRVAEYRARRNGVTPPEGNGGGKQVSNARRNGAGNGVTNGPVTPAPYPSRTHPGPEESPPAPSGQPPKSRVVGEPSPKPTPKPTLVGTLLDKIRALDPELSVFGDQGFTGRKLKENPETDLDLVAEAYVSFRHGEWPGSKMLRESGSLAWVIGDLGGYVQWRNRCAVPVNDPARAAMAEKFGYLGRLSA